MATQFAIQMFSAARFDTTRESQVSLVVPLPDQTQSLQSTNQKSRWFSAQLTAGLLLGDRKWHTAFRGPFQSLSRGVR